METPEQLPASSAEPQMILTDAAQYYLQKSGQWANFLGIIGFIVTGFTVIGAVFAGTIFTNAAKVNPMMPNPAMMGSIMTIFYGGFAVFNFFFSFYIFRFGALVKEGILDSNSEKLTEALNKLKSFFKLWGIATIVIIALYILIFVGAIIFAATLASHMPASGGSQL